MKYTQKSAITTMQEVYELLDYMVKILGLGADFNPDDEVSSYTYYDGRPLFTDEEASILEILIEQAFDVCNESGKDIYEITLDIIDEYNNQ